jgi:hypothetical protein
MADGVFGTKLADLTFVVGVASQTLPDFPFPRGFVVQGVTANTDQVYLRGVDQGPAVVLQGPEIAPGGGVGFGLTNANQLNAISASADQRINLFAVRG